MDAKDVISGKPLPTDVGELHELVNKLARSSVASRRQLEQIFRNFINKPSERFIPLDNSQCTLLDTPKKQIPATENAKVSKEQKKSSRAQKNYTQKP